MKKYLLLIAALLVSTVSFTSCSFDDDDEEEIEEIQTELTDTGYQVVENENQTVLTILVKNVYKKVITATFSEETCSSLVSETTYENVKKAQEAWQTIIDNIDDSEITKYKLSNKTIIYTYAPEEYNGYTKSQIKSYFESIGAETTKNETSIE
ncbi:MAG: hypothetical protein K6E54_03635 [Bacteroidaceae bacterium]|nr:hypothetical protein [Bacteroidaceae bacterium]